jgi:hypothetical protein
MMLATYCTTVDCPERDVLKEVPDELADATIVCGACGEPTTTPATTTGQRGDKR